MKMLRDGESKVFHVKTWSRHMNLTVTALCEDVETPYVQVGSQGRELLHLTYPDTAALIDSLRKALSIMHPPK